VGRNDNREPPQGLEIGCLNEADAVLWNLEELEKRIEMQVYSVGSLEYGGPDTCECVGGECGTVCGQECCEVCLEHCGGQCVLCPVKWQ
jgi:hypothetical protein